MLFVIRPLTRFMHPAASAYRELAACERATSVRKAKWMLLLAENGHFSDGIHSSLAHFAERNGSTAELGRMELDLGHGLRRFPELEALVLEGVIPVPAAAVIGRIVRLKLERPGDDWIETAKHASTRWLQQEFATRREEQMVGEAVFTVSSRLTRTSLDDLTRCRTLVARALDRPVTTGITIGVLAAEYRRRHDPLLRRAGTRRVPDTGGVPGRYVPAAVDREVRRRTGDGCCFPVCDNEIWVDRAHHEPHREGGSREASNLFLFCKRHHRLFDKKRFFVQGTPENPQFFTPDGRRIDARTPYLPSSADRAAERARRAERRYMAEHGRVPERPDPASGSIDPPDSGRNPDSKSPFDGDHTPPPPAAGPPSG